MRKLIFLTIIFIGIPGFADSFRSLPVSGNASEPVRTDRGIIQGKDMAARKILMSGYSYLVDDRTPVTLFGTSAGAYELLDKGMKVEIDYIDLGDRGRLAVRIAEIHAAEQVEF